MDYGIFYFTDFRWAHNIYLSSWFLLFFDSFLQVIHVRIVEKAVFIQLTLSNIFQLLVKNSIKLTLLLNFFRWLFFSWYFRRSSFRCFKIKLCSLSEATNNSHLLQSMHTRQRHIFGFIWFFTFAFTFCLWWHDLFTISHRSIVSLTFRSRLDFFLGLF